jgi:hypothetical protein
MCMCRRSECPFDVTNSKFSEQNILTIPHRKKHVTYEMAWWLLILVLKNLKVPPHCSLNKQLLCLHQNSVVTKGLGRRLKLIVLGMFARPTIKLIVFPKTNAIALVNWPMCVLEPLLNTIVLYTIKYDMAMYLIFNKWLVVKKKVFFFL